MKKNPLDWVEEAEEPTRTYRKMVIGWQNSLIVLSAFVRAYNDVFIKPRDTRDSDTHQVMKEIAVKKLVISSVFELKPKIDVWYRNLDSNGMVTEATKRKKLEVRNLLKAVSKFEPIRNATFHFGDVNEESDCLLELYKDIQSVDPTRLKCILEGLIDLGSMLHDHAKNKT